MGGSLDNLRCLKYTPVFFEGVMVTGLAQAYGSLSRLLAEECAPGLVNWDGWVCRSNY